MNTLQNSTIVLMLTMMWFLLGCAARQPVEIEQDPVCGNGEFEHLLVIKQRKSRADIFASVRDVYTQKNYFVKGKRIESVVLKRGERLQFENNQTRWEAEGDMQAGPVRLYMVSGDKQQFYGVFFSFYDGENYRYRWVIQKREDEK